jgi:hypothetical protein
MALIGIGVTFAVSSANLAYSIWSNKRASFVNTVTASRLKWIDSLRDKVSEFIAVTTCLVDRQRDPEAPDLGALRMQRDTLLHQIILHLNPGDPEDQRIKTLVERVRDLEEQGSKSTELSSALLGLREATGNYLKKEWNRVKRESTGDPS